MRIGKVTFSQIVLLSFLDFVGGSIHSIGMSDNALGDIVLTIQHEDMPEVEEGGLIPDVLLTMTTYEDAQGHKVALRSHPPNIHGY